MFGVNLDRKGAAGLGRARDPAPSRLRYRLNRLWLTPFLRRLMRFGLPVFVVVMIAGVWMSDETHRANLAGAFTGLVKKVQDRDEFMVHTMEIEGASPAVDKGLRAMLPVTLPASSFDIDLDALRARVLKLDAVETVELRIKPGGTLAAVVSERVPVILWRHARGIELLDKTGHRVASVTSRDVRKDLPIIAGEGADKAAPEALLLLDAAGPILPHLRGLERVGARRWDVVLDRNRRIALPPENPLSALERVIALAKAEDILGRDIVEIDMRFGDRPTVRIGLDAQNVIRNARGQPMLDEDGKPLEGSAAKPGASGAKSQGTKTKSAPARKPASRPAKGASGATRNG